MSVLSCPKHLAVRLRFRQLLAKYHIVRGKMELKNIAKAPQQAFESEKQEDEAEAETKELEDFDDEF